MPFFVPIQIYNKSKLNFTLSIGYSNSIEVKFNQIINETTILVPQIYLVCTINPLNFKWAQLVFQVLNMSCINLFTNYH